MQFIETNVFLKAIGKLLTEDEYHQVQMMLLLHPDMGNVIPETGGLRKLRWATKGKGKRSGARIIYYWYSEDDQIYFLYVYKKSARSDLTKGEVKILRHLIEEE